MENSQRPKHFSDLQDLDMKMIEGIPWAEEMWAALLNGATKTFLNWIQVALKMGKEEEDITEWVEVFIGHYEETCCELVSDIEHLQSNLITNIEKSLEKLEQLCKVLQVAMPVFGHENLGLYQEQHQLRKLIEEYELRIKTRTSELKKLKRKQLELCQSLGRATKTMQDNPLPSEQEVQDFKIYLDNLEQEQFNRLEKFCDTKKDICTMINELNYIPSAQFEHEVLSTEESKFLLTDENMRELANFHKLLKKEQTNVRDEISELRSKVNEYWNLLEVPLCQREEFCQKHTGWSFNVLDVLRHELRRCENLKKANIKIFVEKLRQELTLVWDKCHLDDERNNFHLYHSDCYTEDLLELHELELKKWNGYYEENIKILDLLNKHSELWSRMIKLEESADNPDRFNNRGGRLLKEERERNKLAKDIPKIEQELEKMASTYYIHNGSPFQTHGITIQEYIANSHADRENMKKNKLSARKMQREHTMIRLTPSKSVQNLFTGSTTPKRKLPTPLSILNKKPKTTPGRSATPGLTATSSKKANVPLVVVTSVSASKRLSIERRKRINKIRQRSALKDVNNSQQTSNSHSTDYKEFESDISARNDWRSTMNPFVEVSEEQYLKTSVASSSKAQLTPKHLHPRRGTPITSRSPGKSKTNLTAAKSDLKLIF